MASYILNVDAQHVAKLKMYHVVTSSPIPLKYSQQGKVCGSSFKDKNWMDGGLAHFLDVHNLCKLKQQINFLLTISLNDFSGSNSVTVKLNHTNKRH